MILVARVGFGFLLTRNKSDWLIDQLLVFDYVIKTV